jgi:APA family basic amino acid/polyamine antiporter
MFWTMHSGIIAAIAMIFAEYAEFFLRLGDVGKRIAAVAAIVILSGVNLLGVRHGSTLQTLFTAGKIFAIVLMIAVGFALGGGNPDAALRSSSLASQGPSFSPHAFGLALVAGLFAFGGWHMVTYSAGETADPRRTIPRALVIGTVTVTACYIALNAVYLYVLPLQTVASSKRIAADAADAVLGYGGGAAMSALVMFSSFGGLAGVVLTGPRVYYAMARDGMVFRWLGQLHPTRQTPVPAILLQAVWSSVLVATGTYKAVVSRVIYTEWIFFGLMAIGLILLRRRTDLPRTYSVWGYPVVPVVFALAAFGIAVNQILSKPQESMVGLSFVLVGLPIYYLWTRPGRKKDNA